MGTTLCSWPNAWVKRAKCGRLIFSRGRLKAVGLVSRVQLVSDRHEYLGQYIAEPLHAALFNFGWLPGGEKSCTTKAATSLAALQAALDLLQTGGLLLAVLYPGHEAGRQEAEAVEAWAQALPQQQYTVLRYAFANRRNQPPYLLVLEKIHA